MRVVDMITPPASLAFLLSPLDTVDVDQIIAAVAQYFDMKPRAFRGRDKQSAVAHPRRIAMYLARMLTTLSYPAIGDAFRRDHSTVIFGCNKIDQLLFENEDAATYEAVRVLLRQLDGEIPFDGGCVDA
jgi:chromosomal replication initiator protein